MITIFMKQNKTSACAKMWLNNFCINYEIKGMRNITREELMKILSLTENGFEDILVGGKTAQAKRARAFIDRSSFDRAVDFLINSPEFLRSPIVLSGDKVQIGFSEKGMRRFVPREKRRLMKKKIDEELKNEM